MFVSFKNTSANQGMKAPVLTGIQPSTNFLTKYTSRTTSCNTMCQDTGAPLIPRPFELGSGNGSGAACDRPLTVNTIHNECGCKKNLQLALLLFLAEIGHRL